MYCRSVDRYKFSSRSILETFACVDGKGVCYIDLSHVSRLANATKFSCIYDRPSLFARFCTSLAGVCVGSRRISLNFRDGLSFQ